VVAERLAGRRRHDHGDTERQHDRDEGHQRDGQKRGAIAQEVEHLLSEQRAKPNGCHARRSPRAESSPTRCRYTSSSAGISGRTSRMSAPAETSARTSAGVLPSAGGIVTTSVEPWADAPASNARTAGKCADASPPTRTIM